MKNEKLKEYKKKRDFEKTAEPSSAPYENENKPEKDGLRRTGLLKRKFTIQEHKAKKAGLHYDWRLEKDGVAKSFVVRKEIKDGDKFLFIPVEDHPVDYMEWEGTIPDGEYGAGTVRVYAKGIWTELKWGKEIQLDIESPEITGRITLFKKFGKNWMGIFKQRAS